MLSNGFNTTANYFPPVTANKEINRTDYRNTSVGFFPAKSKIHRN